MSPIRPENRDRYPTNWPATLDHTDYSSTGSTHPLKETQ